MQNMGSMCVLESIWVIAPKNKRFCCAEWQRIPAQNMKTIEQKMRRMGSEFQKNIK